MQSIHLLRMCSMLGLLGATTLAAGACDEDDGGGSAASSTASASDSSATTGATTGSGGAGGGATTGSGGAGGGATTGSGGAGGAGGDGCETTGATTGSGAGGAGGSGGAGGAGGSWSCIDDYDESNDVPADATPVYLQNPGDWYGFTDAAKCSGNDDWYLIETSQSDSVPANRTVRVRLHAAGANICGKLCGFVPPPGPQYTVTVEIFDAKTMAPLASKTSNIGVVRMDGTGPQFANDVLIRVSGPPQAVYAYQVTWVVNNGEAGDECEC
jgi:hypothetical protein